MYKTELYEIAELLNGNNDENRWKIITANKARKIWYMVVNRYGENDGSRNDLLDLFNLLSGWVVRNASRSESGWKISIIKETKNDSNK